jgi:threonine 3-dehydrogenase
MAQTVLITGGAGNLACQLTFALANPTTRLVLFDRAEKPVGPVAAGCRYVRGDLTQPDCLGPLLGEHRPDVILHLASLLSGSCEQDRSAAWRINMDGSFALFEAAVHSGVRTVFFPSTLATYGGPLPDPLPEDYPQWPTGLYGVSKVACERLGLYYHEQHGLDFRCLRLPMVISRYAPPGAVSAYGSRAFVEAVERGRFVFPVAPAARLAALYVRDVLRAIVMLLQAPAERLSRRVYNLNGLAPSAQEIADAIARRLEHAELRFEPDPRLTALVATWPRGVVDASARSDWQWQPAYDLDQLADDFIQELQR